MRKDGSLKDAIQNDSIWRDIGVTLIEEKIKITVKVVYTHAENPIGRSTNKGSNCI